MNKPTGKEIVEQIFPYIGERFSESELIRLYKCIDSAINKWGDHCATTPAPSIKGMRWVKCSERLPDKPVYGKFKGMLYPDEIKSGIITPLGNGRFDFTGPSFFYTQLSDYIIEWLDETPSLPSSPNRGYTKEVVDLLNEAAYALNRSYDATEWPADGNSYQELTAKKINDTIASLPNGSSKEEGWVAVEDGLPERNTSVLACCLLNDQYELMGSYLQYENEWMWPDSFQRCVNKITHWRYLPSPPQNKQGD